MYGLQEHEMRFYCLFKKVYFSLLATSDFFCRHAYAYAHMRIIRHESASSASAWPSLLWILTPVGALSADRGGLSEHLVKRLRWTFIPVSASRVLSSNATSWTIYSLHWMISSSAERLSAVHCCFPSMFFYIVMHCECTLKVEWATQ